MESGDIALAILRLFIINMWMVTFTSRPLYFRLNISLPIQWEVGWAPRTALHALQKRSFCWQSKVHFSIGLPVSSSLYRLRRPYAHFCGIQVGEVIVLRIEFAVNMYSRQQMKQCWLLRAVFLVSMVWAKNPTLPSVSSDVSATIDMSILCSLPLSQKYKM